MMKNKKKMLQIKRIRSESQQVGCGSDFQQQMKCHQTFEDNDNSSIYFQVKKQQQQSEKYGCWCNTCLGYMKRFQNIDLDAQQKKRQKRRQYKKRQKLKIQQEKQQALKELTEILSDMYALKTDSKQQKQRIEKCLSKIEKNENRFYQFINAVIRQQVEAIKKQMRICLSQLAADNPNFARVPLLYEQFLKVKQASPEVQYIINLFNKIISEKNKQPPSYHRDLDKKTFNFLIISDMQNRNYFLKVIKLLKKDDVKFERQKEMLRMMISMIKDKKLKENHYHQIGQGQQDDYDDQDDEQDEQDDEYDDDEECEEDDNQYIEGNQSADQQQNLQYYRQHEGQNTTKASEHDEDGDDGQFEQENNKNTANQKSTKRRRKNKNIKSYESSFEKVYEYLSMLEKTLSIKKEEKNACNIDQQWLQRFKYRYLNKGSKE